MTTIVRRATWIAALPIVLGLVAPSARADDADDARRVATDATLGIAPQPARVADSYRRARPLTSPTFTGMLLCEVTVDGESWDGSDPLGPVRRYMGRVELEARVTLPTRSDPIRYLGPEDTNRVTFAIAGVSLAQGDFVGINLVDRDVFDDDVIGGFRLTYDGALPMRASGEHAELECRGATAASLRSAIEDAMEEADDALDDLDDADSPDASLIGFRDDDDDPAEAELAIYDIARLTGLADDRFLSRRDRLRAREAEALELVGDVVTGVASRGTSLGVFAPLAGTDVEIRIDKYDCEVDDVLTIHPELGLDAPMECALHVTFRASRTVTVSQTFHVSDDRGNTASLSRFGVLTDALHRLRTLRVGAGETRVIFAVPIRRGVVLRAARRRTIRWFRLEADPPSDVERGS